MRYAVCNYTGVIMCEEIICAASNTVMVVLYWADPDTGAHTQNIECTWWQIKRSLPETNSRHDGGLLLMFGEYLYRRRYHHEPHLFLTFLRHCAEIYPAKGNE